MKNKVLTLVFISGLIAGCSTREERIRQSAQSSVNNGQYVDAVKSIDRIVEQRKLDSNYYWALNEGVRITIHELNDFKKAIHYLDLISTDSNNFEDIIEAQKRKSEIYFNNFQNYSQAIIEYGKLNLIAKNDADKTESLIYIARSHFYLNQFRDSEIVVLTLLKMKLTDDQIFSANQLLGNVKLAIRDYKNAEEIFLRLLKQFPEKSVKENIFLNLALVYEENDQIDKAVELLNLYKEKYTPKEYIELRIKRLLTRKKNMPGAKGLRK